MDGGNGMPAGMLSSSMTAAGGFLGLDMSLQHHQHHHHHQHGQQQQLLHHPPPPPPPPQQQQQQQQHMMPFQTPPPSSDGDHQPQHPMRHASYVPPFGALRAKQQPAMSSEDDSGFGDVEVDVDARRGGGTPQGMPSLSQQSAPSPWQRMKWTDSMVRLLISVVYHVGDDVGGADGEQQPQPPHGPASKGKKPSASALLQKKGKWKSVSRAMMEKGFYVSPQQCEDKFNDLNKRYKRVNDLLGKGTACRVVENQALLETMDHLPPKAKEEARKLLNSKHLFFREMCAYHNAGLASCNSSQPAAPQAPQPPHAEQQQCLHHPAGQMEAVGIKGSGVGGGGGGGMLEDEGIVAEDDDEDDDVDSEDDDEFDEDDDEDDDELDDHNHHHHHNKGHHHQRQRPHQNKHGDGEDDEDSKLGLGGGPAKRPRRTPSQQQLSSSASPPLSLSLSSPNFTSMQQLKSELVNMAGGGEQQQRQWLRKRASELEEQRVGYQSKAFQLERQRFKWLRFSTNKEREMERMKLDNDRLRLENDRMLLLLRQKEIELIAGNRSGGGEQLHYSAAHSGRPAPDDQPSGTATA